MQTFMHLEKEYNDVYELQDYLQRLQSLKTMDQLQRLQSLETMDQLQRLQKLNDLHSAKYIDKLQVHKTSYEKVPLHNKGIIYCDIPYKNTHSYSTVFNYDKFYDWCEEQTLPVFISEYNMPSDRFRVVASFKKRQLFSAKGAGKEVEEKLWIPINQQQ